MPTVGNVHSVYDFIDPDDIGCFIANTQQEWHGLKQQRIARWMEIRRYISAVDTTTTTNAALPWKNTVTMPKLTQIRDNLHAHYMASMFPVGKRNHMKWEGDNEDDETFEKASATEAYMKYVTDQNRYRNTVSQLVYDYIDYGNVFAMPEWLDERAEQPDGRMQHGYVGPSLKRISPMDIVFNPAAASFEQTPKIIRSLITLGELKELIERLSHDDGQQEWANELWKYFAEMRHRARQFPGDISAEEEFFRIDGFGSFSAYLKSDYVEILTFYGDLYDKGSDKLLKNHVIMVVDRHKVIRNEPNPSAYGYPPIFHVGWRTMQDNLWAMGPLDNLVGLQYRVDHLENLKADLMDLVAFPPVLIKGHVPPFKWGPLEQIVTDADGDVKLLEVDSTALQVDLEIEKTLNKMEEMAGSPKEAMGFRTPGEKTAYEVRTMENGWARIFNAKIAQFEILGTEQWANSMLEMARRRMDPTVVRVIGDEFKIATFLNITPEDITGSGRIRPMAARHFAENAERIQNITAWYQSGIGADENVRMHMSGVKLAQLSEELLDLEDYNLVVPYIRLTEIAEAQRLQMQQQEDTMMGIQQPGMATDDQIEDTMFGNFNMPGEGIVMPAGGMAR